MRDANHDLPTKPPPQNGPSGPVLIIVAAVLIVAGWFLTTKIREMTALQDCLLQGRRNCAPINAGR